MTQSTLRSSAQQKQLAKTSTVTCGVQPHAVVETVPRAGMRIKMTSSVCPFVFDVMNNGSEITQIGNTTVRVVRHTSSLAKVHLSYNPNHRPLKDYLLTHTNMVFNPQATEEQLWELTRPDQGYRKVTIDEDGFLRKETMTCQVFSVPDELGRMVVYHASDMIPMDPHHDDIGEYDYSLPYKQKRGRKKKKTGTDHLLDRRDKQVKKWSTAKGGVKRGLEGRRLFASYAKLGPCYPEPPLKRQKVTHPVARLKGVEQMRVPDSSPFVGVPRDEESGSDFRQEMGVLYGRWEDAGIIRRFICLEIATKAKIERSDTADFRARTSSYRNRFLALISRIISAMRNENRAWLDDANLEVGLIQNEWFDLLVSDERDRAPFLAIYSSTRALEVLDTYVLETLVDRQWALKFHHGVKVQIPPHAPEDYYGPYVFRRMWQLYGIPRLVNPRNIYDVLVGLFLVVRPISFEKMPWMENFVPAGAGVHWDHGGKQLLMARAVVWGIMCRGDHVEGDRINGAELRAVVQVLSGDSGLIVGYLAAAITNSYFNALREHMGMVMSFEDAVQHAHPDFFNGWVSKTIMGRPDEYSTYLENLIGKPVPYWDKIEPILRALFTGWMVERTFASDTPAKQRISAMMLAFSAVYMEHTLTSRTFGALSAKFKAIIQGCFEKLCYILDEIWRKMTQPAREQSFTNDVMDWLSRVFAVVDKQMFSKIMEAVALIGTVFTCPFPDMDENSLLKWAGSFVASLSNTMSNHMKSLSFLERLWELGKFFFTRVRLAWANGDAMMFLYGRDEFVALVDKVNILFNVTKSLSMMSDTRTECVVDGVPYNLSSYKALMAEINVVVKQIQADQKKGLIKELPSFVSVALSRFAVCCEELDAFEKTQRNRPLPFALFLVGPPSAGKNTLLEDVIKTVFDLVEFPTSQYEQVGDGVPRFVGFKPQKLEPVVYTKNAFDEYDSGFANRCNVISFIETGCFNTAYQKGAEQSFNQIASIMNYLDTAPYSPVMADVESKGRLSASSIQMAVLSANNLDLHKDIMRDQMALARRLGKAIRLEVKPRFRDPVTQGVDKTKARKTDYKMDDDMWTYTVLTPVAVSAWNIGQPTTQVNWVTDVAVGNQGVFYTNRDFIEWLVTRVREHVNEQMRVMVQGARAAVAPTCSKCLRKNHIAADHCPSCGGVSHTSEDSNGCANYMCMISEHPIECNLCGHTSVGGVGTPGCSACEEREWADRVAKLADTYCNLITSEDWAEQIQDHKRNVSTPCFCPHCYRWMKANIFNPVTCYGCKKVFQHSYLGQLVNHVSAGLVAKGKSPLDWVEGDGGIYEVIKSHPVFCELTHSTPVIIYLRGSEQMKIPEKCVYAACGLAAGAVGMYLWSPKLKVTIGLTGGAERLVTHVNDGIATVKESVSRPKRSFAERYAKVAPIVAFGEGEWFAWAKNSVVGLCSYLSAFSIQTWVTFAGLATLIVTLCRAFTPRISLEVIASTKKKNYVSSLTVRPFWGETWVNSFSYPSEFMEERKGVEQMRLFDAEFIDSILTSHGIVSGAHASLPSTVKIDNPWLAMPSLGVKENVGRRTSDRGPEQCKLAVARIERSIYKIASAPVHSSDVERIQSIDLEAGTHVHCLLLHGSIFVVNTHFLVQSIIQQYQAICRYDTDKSRVDAVVEAMADCLDWDELVTMARQNGVTHIWVCIVPKFHSGCEGVSIQKWEQVDLINIVGNIHQDVGLIRFTRFAGQSNAGLVRRVSDLGNSLLVPREHSAPTQCVLVDREVDGITDNFGVALFRRDLHFDIMSFGKERAKPTDVWSLTIDKATENGDCGLPLVGVWHTKYHMVNRDGVESKVVDPKGDVVFVLGMHRIYQVASKVTHCAPLSIDMVSLLWGKLDKQQVIEEQCWKLYSLPSFGAGSIPTSVPKIDHSRPIDLPFSIDSLQSVGYSDVVFQRGSRNEYHDKSPLQWMGVGEVLPYAPDLGEARALHGLGIGSVSGFRQGMFKSSVTRLPTANWFGYEQRHFVPNLNDRRGKEMNLVTMAGATDGSLDYSLLRRVANDMVVETIAALDNLDPGWRTSVHPLTDVETVGGSNVTNFTPPVNRSTGMGFPFYGSKESHLQVERDKWGAPVSVLVRDEVLADIRRHIEAYANHERAYPVFTATPKDERISGSKVIPVYDVSGNKICDAHNLRIFLCGSYSFIHLQRQQYMSIIRLICDHPEVFEMAVGTNVCSKRWGLMGDWLSWDGAASGTILAGDYSKYDKRMTATWISTAFEVLLSLMSESGGYTDGDLLIASGIAIDTATPLIDWFGDWFIVTNGHPSGHALTTIINGIVNRLYLRYAYYVLWRRRHPTDSWELCQYQKCVRTYVYGDDNISGVVGEAVQFFDMPNVSRVLQGVGVILTTEDKSAIVESFTSMEKASFLKRKWVEHEGRVMAPLSLKSLEAMVTMGVLNTNQTATQMFQLLRSYCDEFFHYGREAHDRARAAVMALCLAEEYWVEEGFPMVGQVLRSEVLRDVCSAFPTYDDLIARWEKADFVRMY